MEVPFALSKGMQIGHLFDRDNHQSIVVVGDDKIIYVWDEKTKRFGQFESNLSKSIVSCTTAGSTLFGWVEGSKAGIYKFVDHSW